MTEVEESIEQLNEYRFKSFLAMPKPIDPDTWELLYHLMRVGYNPAESLERGMPTDAADQRWGDGHILRWLLRHCLCKPDPESVSALAYLEHDLRVRSLSQIEREWLRRIAIATLNDCLKLLGLPPVGLRLKS